MRLSRSRESFADAKTTLLCQAPSGRWCLELHTANAGRDYARGMNAGARNAQAVSRGVPTGSVLRPMALTDFPWAERALDWDRACRTVAEARRQERLLDKSLVFVDQRGGRGGAGHSPLGEVLDEFGNAFSRTFTQLWRAKSVRVPVPRTPCANRKSIRCAGAKTIAGL